MATSAHCTDTTPHRRHTILIAASIMYDDHEYCDGIPTPQKVQKAELKAARAELKHLKKMQRVNRKLKKVLAA